MEGRKRVNKTLIIAGLLLVIGIVITLLSIFGRKKKEDNLIKKSAENNTKVATSDVADASDITPLITQIVEENVTETKVDTITVDDKTGDLVIDDKSEDVKITEDKEGNKIATIKTEEGDVKVAVKTNEEGKIVVDNNKTIVADNKTGEVVVKDNDNTPQSSKTDDTSPTPTPNVETTVKVDDKGNVVIEKKETTVTTVTVMPTATDIPKTTPTKSTEIKEALTPTPRVTNTPIPKVTETPTPKPVITNTPTDKPTNTPTPTSTSKPTPTTKPTTKPTNTPTPISVPTSAVCSHKGAVKQYYTRNIPSYDEPITQVVTHTICKLCGADRQDFIDAYNNKDAEKLNEMYLVDTEMVGYYNKTNIEKNPNYLLEHYSNPADIFSAHCGGSWYQTDKTEVVGYNHHEGWTVSVYKGTYCPDCDTWLEKYYIEDTCPANPEWWFTDELVEAYNSQWLTNATKEELFIEWYIRKEKLI